MRFFSFSNIVSCVCLVFSPLVISRHVPSFQSSPPGFYLSLFLSSHLQGNTNGIKTRLGPRRINKSKSFTTHPPDDQYEKIHNGINGVLRKEIQSAVPAGRRPSFRHVCVCAFVDVRHAALCARACCVFAKTTFFFVAFGKKKAISEARSAKEESRAPQHCL